MSGGSGWPAPPANDPYLSLNKHGEPWSLSRVSLIEHTPYGLPPLFPPGRVRTQRWSCLVWSMAAMHLSSAARLVS
jgi:hypothetical protein